MKDHIFVYKAVLREVAAGLGDKDVAASVRSTSFWDADVSDNAQTKKGSLMSRVWRYVTETMVHHLEMYAVTTHAFHEEYSHRTSQVETMAEWRSYLVDGVMGQWTQPLRDMFRESLATVANLRFICPESDGFSN